MNETDPLDQLEQLVSERYPKGTTESFGKALRYQLHRLGRLNEPTKHDRKVATIALLELAADALTHSEYEDVRDELSVRVAKIAWECIGSGDINKAVARRYPATGGKDKLAELVCIAAPGATNAEAARRS